MFNYFYEFRKTGFFSECDFPKGSKRSQRQISSLFSVDTSLKHVFSVH